MSRVADRVRGRFELVPGQHRPKPVRNGLIFLAIIGLMAYTMYTRGLPFMPKAGDAYQAEFAYADYIKEGVPVRVAGVDVGKVESVERQEDGSGAVVKFRITDPAVVVKRDAYAHLWWRTLLGFNYEVELFPGSASADRLPEDQPIPQHRNGGQVDFDTAFQPLDSSGRAGMRGFFAEFDRALAGSGAGRTIERLGPATESMAPATDSLRGMRPGDLATLVDRTGRAMRAVGRQERNLVGLLRHGAVTFDTLGDERQALAEMIEDGPETMADTRLTMRRLRTTFDELDPLANQLRPGSRRLDEAANEATVMLREGRPLLVDLRELLADLTPAVRSLESATNDAIPLMDDLMPTLRRTDKQIIPWLRKKDAGTELPNHTAIGAFFAGTASIAARYNEPGHQVHFGVGIGEGVLGGFLPCTIFTDDEDEQDCLDLDLAMTTALTGTMPRNHPSTLDNGGRRERDRGQEEAGDGEGEGRRGGRRGGGGDVGNPVGEAIGGVLGGLGGGDGKDGD